MTINLLTKLVEVHRGWCNYCAGNVKVCDNCPKGGCTLRDYLQSLSQEAVRDEAEWLIFMEGKRAGRAEAEQALKLGPLGMRVCEPPCHSAGACLHPDNCRANMKWENERALKREPNAAPFDMLAELKSRLEPVPATPDVAEMVKRLRGLAQSQRKHADGWDRRMAHTEAGNARILADAFDEAAALLAKLGQGWIPVSERLPTEAKDQIMCLVSCAATEDDSAGVSVASYDEDEREWNHRLDTGCWTPGEVTHWMPLPSAPGASDD